MSHKPELVISFPGGKRVDADFAGTVIKTDQSPRAGGEGSAPEPYALFLASIGTCAGIYVLGFCQSRGLPTEGIEIRQGLDFHPAAGLRGIELDIRVPASFPAKYHDALVRAAETCAVKKALQSPPDFDVHVTVADSARAVA